MAQGGGREQDGGKPRPRPVSRARASAARKNSASDRLIENANSPASVAAALPPQIVWNRSKTNGIVATAMSAGVGKGSRSWRPSDEAAAGKVNSPTTDTTLKATP